MPHYFGCFLPTYYQFHHTHFISMLQLVQYHNVNYISKSEFQTNFYYDHKMLEGTECSQNTLFDCKFQVCTIFREKSDYIYKASNLFYLE